MILQCER